MKFFLSSLVNVVKPSLYYYYVIKLTNLVSFFKYPLSSTTC